jgi:hypothetical protein
VGCGLVNRGRAAAAADNAIPTLGARHTGNEAESSPPNSCGAVRAQSLAARRVPAERERAVLRVPAKRLEFVRARKFPVLLTAN